MGKTMKKSTIIWGEKHSVTLANFNDAHLKDIEAIVRQQIGPRAAFARAAASKAIQQAKTNPKMKHAYVKVGLIDGAVVLRCKEKKFFGDIEVDATLVTDYKGKANAYIQEMLVEFEQEQERQRQELARLKSEEERQKRLKEVMGRKDKDGTTLRDRLLRAAETAQKLGIGNYAQTKLKVQGLQAMDPQYHGEVLDRKQNRYGRYLPDLKKVWDKQGEGKPNFTDWLDAVEKNDTSVPGVTEARQVTNPEVGKVVQPGGIAGGLMVYLDDEARKGYVATASKGALTGPTVKNGQLIFVIGSDSKLYVGSKARAKPGERGAFNHSSFFSGGPVKSAGTLTVAGGKVTTLNDQSGHYAPTRPMVVAAMRKIGGNDDAWLQSVQVTVGGKTTTGRVYLDGAIMEESIEIWGKYSIGTVSRPQAEAYLKAAPDGSWLVRIGTGNATVFSVRKGEAFTHDVVSKIGGAGLDRKKLLTKDKLPDVPPVPEVTPKTTRRKSVQQVAPETTAPKGRSKPSEQTEIETEQIVGLSPRNDQALRSSPAWHGDINRTAAEGLLRGKPGSWLLRVGRDNQVALSQNVAGQLGHTLVLDDETYAKVATFMRRNSAGMVRP